MVFEQLKSRVENVDSIDGTLKFVVDDNAIFIDGTGEKNSISAEDKDADCTISVSSDVLKQLRLIMKRRVVGTKWVGNKFGDLSPEGSESEF